MPRVKTLSSQPRAAAGICYVLVRRRVKNINLRVERDGTVRVSAHPLVPAAQVDAFVAGRAEWVFAAQQRLRGQAAREAAQPLPDRKQALETFRALSARYYPLFADVLHSHPPEICVRDMRTRWGVCHMEKRRITLALRLAAQPPECMEYVMLHEYCHFVYPNHQKEFWALVEAYMPDAKARRRRLNSGG